MRKPKSGGDTHPGNDLRPRKASVTRNLPRSALRYPENRSGLRRSSDSPTAAVIPQCLPLPLAAALRDSALRPNERPQAPGRKAEKRTLSRRRTAPVSRKKGRQNLFKMLIGSPQPPPLCMRHFFTVLSHQITHAID